MLHLTLAGALAGGLSGCSAAEVTAPDVTASEGQVESACGPVVVERLDASSALHLLPGAPEPNYLSDPPTSGPHLSGRPPMGTLDAALDRPTQVLVLETGGVLIQHRDLSGDEVASLQALASDQVVVAPNPSLPAPVVATAWLTKQTCPGVNLDALSRFVGDHLGQGPDADEGNAADVARPWWWAAR